MNILGCFPWFAEGLVGLRGEVHGDVEEVHLDPVGLSSWDPQAVLLHDPVDLLQGQLRLPVGELAGGESVWFDGLPFKIKTTIWRVLFPIFDILSLRKNQ